VVQVTLARLCVRRRIARSGSTSRLLHPVACLADCSRVQLCRGCSWPPDRTSQIATSIDKDALARCDSTSVRRGLFRRIAMRAYANKPVREFTRGPGCSPFGGVIIARTHYGQRDACRARRPGQASSRRHRMAMRRRPLPRPIGTRGTPSRPHLRPPLAYAPTCQYQARQVSLRPREWIEESTIRATIPSGPLHSATFAQA
jgi:hypothetical protein